MNDALIESTKPPERFSREEVEDTIRKGVFRALQAVTKKGVTGADVRDFCLSLIQSAPEKKTLAELVWETFMATQPGSMGRVQIIKAILQIQLKLLDFKEFDAESADDDELEREAAILLSSLIDDVQTEGLAEDEQ